MEERSCLITGASGDIGSATVRAIAPLYTEMLLQYRTNHSFMEALENELQENFPRLRVRTISCDLSQREEIFTLVEAKKQFMKNPLDSLIHCHGIAHFSLIQEIDDRDWEHVLHTNLSSVFWLVREFVPEMLHEHRGNIVNVSSMWGEAGSSMETVYAASKGAVNAFTKSLAKELGLSGIRVNAVAPGVIQGKMNFTLGAQSLQHLAESSMLGRLGSAEEVANVIRFLVSDESRFIQGQVLHVDGGFIG